MEIDFIQIEHRQNVLKLMELCGLDMKQAYDLYSDTGCNFQTAVNMHFNSKTAIQQPQSAPSYSMPPPALENYPQQQLKYVDYQKEDLAQEKYQKYVKFMKIGKRFPQKYIIQRKQGFLKSLIPTFFKGDDEEPFKKQLQKFVGKRIDIKFAEGHLSQNFEWSWKQKYPLAIVVLDFVSQSRELIKKVFLDHHFVQKVLCEQFRVFGFNAFQGQREPKFTDSISPQKDRNSIIIARVNYLDQVRIVGRIKITPNIEQNIKKLKVLKSKCIQLQMEDSFIVKRYAEQSKGNIDYQSPKTVRENLKIKQDRQIRRQQEEEFYKACRPKNQQQLKQESRDQKPKVDKVEPKRNVQKAQQKKISVDQISKLRQSKRSKMRMYDKGVSFKIRLPSGQNIMLQVDGSQKVQYLFDYIQTLPENIGFEKEQDRKFNITVGFGGSITLKGKQKNKISQLFSNSQVLIVHEISQ